MPLLLLAICAFRRIPEANTPVLYTIVHPVSWEGHQALTSFQCGFIAAQGLAIKGVIFRLQLSVCGEQELAYQLCSRESVPIIAVNSLTMNQSTPRELFKALILMMGVLIK